MKYCKRVVQFCVRLFWVDFLYKYYTTICLIAESEPFFRSIKLPLMSYLWWVVMHKKVSELLNIDFQWNVVLTESNVSELFCFPKIMSLFDLTCFKVLIDFYPSFWVLFLFYILQKQTINCYTSFKHSRFDILVRCVSGLDLAGQVNCLQFKECSSSWEGVRTSNFTLLKIPPQKSLALSKL